MFGVGSGSLAYLEGVHNARAAESQAQMDSVATPPGYNELTPEDRFNGDRKSGTRVWAFVGGNFLIFLLVAAVAVLSLRKIEGGE